jgi:putative glutathione S-transferase
MARALKGLEDVISITVVMPIWQRTTPDNPNDEHTGWMFADHSSSGNNVVTNSAGLGGPFPSSYPSNEADPIFNARSVRNIYQKVGDKDGKYSVPILFDKKLQTIVSNESSEIIQMLNSQFDEYVSCSEVDLEPEDLKEAMESVDSWIYPSLNNGVYRCGFAKTQEAYDTAIDELTAAFDRAEDILSSQRYIAGDRFTLSDIRLFVTLLRFDEVYVVYFKTNTRSVANSPVLLNYCRDIYQMPGVAETVDMHQIKEHYFCSHPDLNKFSIIPRGPDFERMLQAPHNRGSFEVKRRRISQAAVSDEEKHSLKSDESVESTL